MVVVSAIDEFDIINVVLSLRLSTAEARDLAARMVRASDEADRMAAKERA